MAHTEEFPSGCGLVMADVFTDEDTDENVTASSSCSISLKSSGSTTGLSSMDTVSENLRFVNSNGTLDDFFRERPDEDQKSEKEEDKDEGVDSHSDLEQEEDEGVDSQSEDDNSDVRITVTFPGKTQLNVKEEPLCQPLEVNSVTEVSTTSTATPSALISTTAQEVSTVEDERLNAPLKFHLQPVCTIGAGTFGRVALTKHKVTNHYYALKAMYIPYIVDRRQVQHVHNEKRILQKLNHPFIVKMFDTAKDTRNLYMIMEFLAGGELFAYLRATKVFPSSMVKFYAAEVILALEYLHGMKIPENLMLTQEGHVKLTDFGFAKEIHNKSYTLCGTAEYLAPELANRSGHNHTVDYWALGILIFELMAGFAPFRGSSTDEVQERIEETEGTLEFPKKVFSVNAKDVISQLLTLDPKQRLGANGIQEIKDHIWFEPIAWEEMLNCRVQPPLTPTVYYEGDTGNFDSYAEEEKRSPAKQRDLDLFDEW